MVAIANAIGGSLSEDSNLLWGLIFGVIRGVVFWAVWALLVLLIGTTILKSKSTEADWGQLARCTGFAQTPGILGILVFIPIAGPIIAFLAFIWQIAAMVVAVRQSLDYTSTLRAFFVILIAVAVPLILVIFFGIFFFSLAA